MSLPILYQKLETNFNHLGLGILKDAISCLVTEERNGIFELEVEYPITGTFFYLLENDLIIKCHAGHALKNQLFRIKKITKKSEGIVSIYAQHVSYLSQDLVLRPDVLLNGDAQSVLRQWSSSIIDSHPFEVVSDILTQNQTHLNIKDCKNTRQALGGVRGSILDVWGGEYRFDNYRISLLANRGGNANTLIAYGRNLTDLQQEENITNTYTSLYPYAIYTERREDGSQGLEEIITIDGFIVDSEYVSAYPNRRIFPIDFSDEFENEERPTSSRLRSLAEQYIKANNIGVPKVSLEVSFVDLTKSLNYSGNRYEELNLCDTVPIYFERLNIQTRAKIIRIEWNVLLDQYEKLEIGEPRASLSDKIREIETGIKDVENDANHALISANGRNTVFYGPDEPTANRVGDLWYKPNGENTELYMWNGSAWQFVSSTAPDQDLLDKIQNATGEAERALEQANNSMNEVLEVRDQAQIAFDNAQSALGTSHDAEKAAQDAREQANNARQDAEKALTNADHALVRIENTEENITQITADIDGISTVVGEMGGNITHLQQTAQGLQTSVSSVDGRVTNISMTVDGISTSVSNMQGNITNINTTVNGINTTVANAQGDINRLQQTANSLTSRVENAEGNITTVTQLAQGIQTTVSGPNGLQSQVTQLAGQITQEVEDREKSIGTVLAQTSENIALAVRDLNNNIINQINISPESILIAGNKIHITGQTTIDNAVITNAHIKDIDAVKITTGTLNAANVDIINLNADNITTGTLRSITVTTESEGATVTMAQGQVSMSQNTGDNRGGSLINPTQIRFRPTSSNLPMSGNIPANLEVQYRPEGIYRRVGTAGQLNNFTHYINFVDGNEGIRVFGRMTVGLHGNADGGTIGLSLNNSRLTSVSRMELSHSTGNQSGLWFAPTPDQLLWNIFNANGNGNIGNDWLHISPFRPANAGGTIYNAQLMSFKRSGQSGSTTYETERGSVRIMSGNINVESSTNWNDRSSFVIVGQNYGISRNGTAYNNVNVWVSSTGSFGVRQPGQTSGNFRPIQASAFSVNSVRASKTHLKAMKELDETATHLINRTQLYEYDLVQEVESGIPHKNYGVMVEEAPIEITSRNGESIELYSMVSYAWKAIQELTEANKQLTKRIETLERGVGIETK